VRDLHEKIGFDVIHDNQCLGYGLLLMKQIGIPLAATIHHPLSVDLENVLERVSTFKKKIKSVIFYPTLMQAIVSRRLDAVITVSEDSKRRITKDFGVKPERQTVVYNGIDTSIFRPVRSIKKIPGKILFVGNVEDGKKGFIYLLKAMNTIDSRIRLTVVDGGSPHRNITGMLMKKYNLYDRVDFPGAASQDELVRHYNEAEITVVPSVYEGFGFPAAEAMACGSPVISSDGGALPEVVGDAGIIIPSRDHAAIAEAVNFLAFDKKHLREFRDNGIDRVKHLFRWDTAVKQMTDLFEGMKCGY
jgi:glycosyltransferase involved in cell wall biosynthesis